MQSARITPSHRRNAKAVEAVAQGRAEARNDDAASEMNGRRDERKVRVQAARDAIGFFAAETSSDDEDPPCVGGGGAAMRAAHGSEAQSSIVGQGCCTAMVALDALDRSS
jgi:hypothetical protein